MTMTDFIKKFENKKHTKYGCLTKFLLAQILNKLMLLLLKLTCSYLVGIFERKKLTEFFFFAYVYQIK